MTRTFAVFALAALPSVALGAGLPDRLVLDAPFPPVTTQAPTIERVAPGIEYGEYDLLSDAGPIDVHVVAADLANPNVRAQTVLAGDRLTSDAESVTSMAQRTNAVAGINGDYFDIGQTNRPTNIVVRDGELVRTPRKRYALAILRSGVARLAEFSFSGSLQFAEQRVPLEGVNVPPEHDNGIALLTPAFGPPPNGLTLISLAPSAGAPPFASYRAGTQDYSFGAPAGYYLAAGRRTPADLLPNDGDAVQIAGDIAPISLDQIAAAIGGGPLILSDGAWYDDPDGPRGGAYESRIPCSGAALESDGTLLLVEVDGRQPQESIGLTRREFAELMRALGARDGMALDGGGSSELAVRLLGDDGPALATSPSDGTERRVADGIFLYNDSPVGDAVALAAAPQTIRALSGAQVPFQVSAVDANEHPLAMSAPIDAVVEPATLGSVDDGRFVANAPGSGRILLHAGTLATEIPVEVARDPARIVLDPPASNVDPHGSVTFRARAFDDAGYAIALPQQLPWTASSGTINALGEFVAADRDADVALALGQRAASVRVTVGSHSEDLDLTHDAHFLSFPAGGAGSVRAGDGCANCIRLAYALGAGERAAYAVVEQPLPARVVGLSFDLRDDGSGAELRVALRNAINEQVLVTATALDRAETQRVTVRFPAGLAQPLRLIGFYALATAAAPNASGAIVISNLRALVSGSQ